MSINKVMLLGRLGQDPEIKHTPSGASVCRFSVATSETWKDKQNGQKQERTEWHRIVAWGKVGELCHQYLSKGRQVFVEGRIQTNAWEDKNGVKRYTTEVFASSVQFIGSATDTQSNSYSDQNSGMRGDDMPPMDDGPYHGNGGSGGQSSSNQNNSQNNKNKEYNLSSEANFTADDIPF